MGDALERNYAIDYMKFFAIYLVVCTHSITFNASALDSDYINLIINNFPRFVIPFFFVVSGFLFGHKIKTIDHPKKYFNKYILRMTKFFIFWYAFYMIYDLLVRVTLAVYLGLNIKTEIFNYLISVLHIGVLYYGIGLTSFHLWYLTALIWSIVILYIFIRKERLNLLLACSLILNLIGLFGQTYSGAYHLGIQTRDALFFGLFYTTLGCYFAFNYDWIKEKVCHIKTALLISLILIFSATQIIERAITVSFWDGSKGGVDYYLSTIPLTICLFLVLIKKRNLGKNSMISKAGRNAGGIYVSHMLFISIAFLTLHFFGIERLAQNILFHLLFPLVVFVASHYFYLTLQMIKYKLGPARNMRLLGKLKSIS